MPSEHGEPVKAPDPLVVKVTVPVGALVVPPDVSVTVAVHVVAVFLGIELGLHETPVVVVRVVTVSANVPELAP